MRKYVYQFEKVCLFNLIKLDKFDKLFLFQGFLFTIKFEIFEILAKKFQKFVKKTIQKILIFFFFEIINTPLF